jgi:thiamine kinase-like enzyme
LTPPHGVVSLNRVEGIDPELAAAIRAVPGWAGLPPEAITPLAGGITNRNFRIDVGGGSYVLRLPGRDTALLGIDRVAEWEATRAAAAAGVAPEPFAFLRDSGVLVTRFLDARPLEPGDLARAEGLAPAVAAIRALHAMPPIPSRFSPFRVVRDYRRVAAERGVAIPAAFADALARADEIERACRARPVPLVPCHNDLLSTNFLVRDGRVFVVDYEYAGMGDPFFDLGNFAVNNGLAADAEATLLERYLGTVRPAARARLRLMRIMSDFREAMWGVVQQGLSALAVDYGAYARRHFERCLDEAGAAEYRSWLARAASAEAQ